MRRTATRTLALTAAGTLLLTASGCGERELELGEATTIVEGGESAAATGGTPTEAAEPTAPAESAALDPRLDPEPSVIGTEGALSIHLPIGWQTYPGTDMATSGEASMARGGLRTLSVPAEGKDQAEWEAALIAGATEYFVDEQGMEARTPITTGSGLAVFHLVQVYSDNKAQLFGTVVDDTLHTVRFGLDGSEEAAAIAALSAATLSLS